MLLAGVACATLAATYRVSQSGGGDYRTIQDCVDGANPGDTCSVLPGVYREAVNVQEGINIVGVDRDRVILEGTDTLPDQWTRYKGSIYKTQLTGGDMVDIQQVFVDNRFIVEARWPNANLDDMLDLTRWAIADNASYGRIVDSKLVTETPGIDWTGALMALNSDLRVLSFTRTVQNYNPADGSFEYQLPLPGEKPRTPAQYQGTIYVLSGKLEALDVPGEWYLNRDTYELYVWMPDSQPPGQRVQIKKRSLCVMGTQSVPSEPIHVTNMSFHGCTVSLYNCDGCAMQDLILDYPSYSREIEFLNEPHHGPMPNMTILQGNNSVIERVSLHYSNIGGILVMGWRNRVEDSLIVSTDWFGTLDFPPLQIGFGPSHCGPGVDDDTNTDLRPQLSPELGHCGHWLRDVHTLPDHVRGDLRQVMGTDNVITRVTVKDFGNSGIVTSQLSCEVSYSHVANGGLVGCDHAGIHVDNLITPCMTQANLSNCTKAIHHNWVHNCREKCVRGDDATVNLTAHRNVIWNCGYPQRDARHGRSASGLVFKGDYNVGYFNTMFNVSFPGNKSSVAHGELVVYTKNGPPPPGCVLDECPQMNRFSKMLNNVAQQLDTQGGPPLPTSIAYFNGTYQGPYTSLRLRDIEHFDFRPLPSSPLYGTGVVHPPEAPPIVGSRPNIGAMQPNEPRWTAGCSAFLEC